MCFTLKALFVEYCMSLVVLKILIDFSSAPLIYCSKIFNFSNIQMRVHDESVLQECALYLSGTVQRQGVNVKVSLDGVHGI